MNEVNIVVDGVFAVIALVMIVRALRQFVAARGAWRGMLMLLVGVEIAWCGLEVWLLVITLQSLSSK